MKAKAALVPAAGLILLILIPAAFVSCGLIDSDNNSVEVPFKDLYTDSARCHFRDAKICMHSSDLSCLELVLDNATDFYKYIYYIDSTADNPTPVDFHQYFVIAGMTGPQPYEPYTTEQSLSLESNRLKYRVTIALSIFTAIGNARYIIAVPRRYAKYPIEFIVTME